MADQILKNDDLAVTAAASQWGAIFRLVELMILAGWTIHEMSDGTTKGTGDNWSGNFGGLGSNTWIILDGPGGRQVLFHRDAASTFFGWVRYDRTGAYDTSGTNVAPSVSGVEVDIRGAKGGANHYWGAFTSVPTQAQIFADDPANGGSFGFVGQPTGNTDNATRLAFCELEGGEAGDVDPYAWWTPPNLTNWTAQLNNHEEFLGENNIFRAWVSDGSSFVAFGSGAPYEGWDSGSTLWGGDGSDNWRGASTIDKNPAGDWRLWRLRPMEQTLGHVKGMTKRFGVVSNQSGATTGQTFATGIYAKIGTFLWWPWDSAITGPGTPP